MIQTTNIGHDQPRFIHPYLSCPFFWNQGGLELHFDNKLDTRYP